MPLAVIRRYLKKAVKLLKNEGWIVLISATFDRIIVELSWRLSSLLQIIPVKTQTISGLSRHKLVLFSGVPYDDVGGGQRSAQLTRAALRTGIPVLYVYAYPKCDVAKRQNVESKIRLPNLVHKRIGRLTAREFIKFVDEYTTVIFELPHPLFEKYLETARTRNVRTIFELIDDWNTSLGGELFNADIFKKFVLSSTMVVGTSKILVKQLVEMGRSDALYLPNAANETIFNFLNSYERPADLPMGACALYFGSLYGEWFGWEYIRESADRCPGLNFCLVGNKPQEIPLPLPTNVHFLGEKKIEELPAYLSAALFCLLPFKPSKLSEAVSPIKVFEYIFMLKPVVSSWMEEVRGYPYVFSAQNVWEFADLCEDLYNDRMTLPAGKKDIQGFIAQNSWFSRLHKLIDAGGERNTSAIILVHNNRDIIGGCLKSLLDNCSSYLADVVVVDNASDDGSGDYVVENFPHVRVIRNPVNGCSSGRNLGVKNSTGKYLAFFDSDQWFTGGFCFEEALCILGTRDDIGAVGWAAGWLYQDHGNLKGSIVDFYPYRAMHTKASLRGYRTDVAYLGTGGFFIPRSIFYATGGFDVAYDPTTFEDTDLSFAIKRLGYKLAYRDLSCIRHEAHQTTTASTNSPEYQALYSRNSAYLLNKWKDFPILFRKYTL